MTDGTEAGEAVPLDRVAGLGPRFAARVIDGVLLAALGGALGVVLDFELVWLVLQAALAYGYFVVLDATVGTTAGKRALRLELQGPRSARPTTAEAAKREAFVLLGAIPYAGAVLALVAWVAIAVSIRSSGTGRGVHDSFAGGTLVVRT
jgi:hypothetical protein